MAGPRFAFGARLRHMLHVFIATALILSGAPNPAFATMSPASLEGTAGIESATSAETSLTATPLTLAVYAVSAVAAPASGVFVDGGVTYKVLGTTEVQVGDGINPAFSGVSPLVIPQTVTDSVGGGTYTVVAVGDRAFQGDTRVISVSLPQTIRTIGNHAFAGCPAAAGMSLPRSLVSLGNNAFLDVPMTSVDLPAGLVTIGNQAFKNTALVEAVLPKSLASIGIDAFYGTPQLSRVVYLGKKTGYAFAAGVSIFYSVEFLDSAGAVVSSTQVSAGETVAEIPALPADSGLPGYWKAEDGHSLYTGATDSFTVTATYGLAIPIDIAECTIDAIAPQVFTGSAVQPTVVVLDPEGQALIEGVDYMLSFENNVEIGAAAKAVVVGTGEYRGVLRASFEIFADSGTRIDIAGARITPIPAQPYTGQDIRPAVSVALGTGALVSGTDYVVTYSDNRGVGTATVTVFGVGQYKGVVATTFVITTDAPTPDNIVNFAVLDAVIRTAERIDCSLYTTDSVERLDGYLAQARTLRQEIIDLGLVTLDKNQNRVNEAARILYVGITALVDRFGPVVSIVAESETVVVREAPESTAPEVSTLTRGDGRSARVDRNAQGAWWYRIEGGGYVSAGDVFEFPIPGVGDSYQVVCINDSVSARSYPFEWAAQSASFAKQTTLTVKTVSDEWLVTAWSDSDGVTRYGYLRASDVAPVEGSLPDPGTAANPKPKDPDVNVADPTQDNPETRPSVIPGHGVGGTGPNPEGLLPIDWWPGSNTTGIDRFERFWVKFPHNISDPGDAEVNVTKVILRKADGSVVPSRVYTMDRNLYPDTRRYIYIAPLSPLDWGTRYSIDILPGFQSRNGMRSTVTMSIPFSTEVYPYARGGGVAPPSRFSPTGKGIQFGGGAVPGHGGSGPGTGGTGTGTGGGAGIGAGAGGTGGGGFGTGGTGTGGLGGASAHAGGISGAGRSNMKVNAVSAALSGLAQNAVAAVGGGGGGGSVMPINALGGPDGFGISNQATGGAAPIWPGVAGGTVAAIVLVYVRYRWVRRQIHRNGRSL